MLPFGFLITYNKSWFTILYYQSTVSGNGPQDESVAQQKVEATSENNPTSNHSSDHVACIQKNKEALNKVSDAQVSVSHFLDILLMEQMYSF